ncbi:aldo/keto reductase [Peribacillus huizhouensis]|uniref:Aryl-alcohol dehydrogenase-like predicted oxidoreductase n=1 Tax=Peribacillus huizhouensis TaxID=1501239 RepID=A0ABR6CPM0_9BACI|nr:aldo/keto reductase [Peribacillus huizhouensis]MBA9026646.1 aryl-alcohol dehydrogenase-like predicted oxidoreductase [Peribacillus huizhouensis]
MVQQVRIGKTDLYVNPIGLGTNAVGGHNIYPNLNDETGKDVVRAAFESGINFLDTAYIYGPKRSEELIGEVIKERGNRSDIVIATKGAHKFVDGKVVFDNSPAFLRDSVESSLERLQTDYIDLFYIHFPDEATPKDEAVGALKELRDQGKIRAIGVSNFSSEQLIEANKDGYVDVYQGWYNLFKREAERDLLPFAEKNNISFIPYFPLASGLLGGKYNSNSTFNDGRAQNPLFQGDTFISNLEKVEQVREIANNKGVEVADIVLAWYLQQPAIDVLIPGAKKPEQVSRNLNTLKVVLTKDEIEKIGQIFK